MRRHLRILDLALDNLLRSKAKTLSVLVVYALLVAVVASLLLYVEALRQEAEWLLASAPEIVVQRQTGGRHDLVPTSRGDEIGRLRGVTAVTPRLWGYTYDPASGVTLTLWAAESVPAGTLEDGDELALAPGECVVGKGVAEARFLWPGDRLPLAGSDGRLWAPRVVGIFDVASSVLTNDLVILPAADLRPILGVAPGWATDLAVSVHQPREIETVAGKIRQLWPDVRVVTRRQIRTTWQAVFDWRGGLWATLLVASVAAFAILVWSQASGLSAEERHMFGVLKAVGWSDGDVLELAVWEGAVVSAVAVVSGIVAAQVHLVVFDGALFAPLLRGWSETFPTLAPRPTLDGYALVLCLLLTALPYVAASLVPAWRAAITDPDTILRG